jgi:hypothetical protein
VFVDRDGVGRRQFAVDIGRDERIDARTATF